KGRAKGKPIAQLPSADGPTATDGDRQLRQRVLSAKGMKLKSRIVDKNLGNFTHTELRNSIRVLEVDYYKEGSEWKFGKTPYKPILGYSDGQGILRFPKVEIMDGVSPGVIREINKLAGVERPKDVAPGSIVVARTNPKGGFRVAQLHPRKINSTEVQWVKNNIVQFLAEGRLPELRQVVNITALDIRNLDKLGQLPTNRIY